MNRVRTVMGMVATGCAIALMLAGCSETPKGPGESLGDACASAAVVLNGDASARLGTITPDTARSDRSDAASAFGALEQELDVLRGDTTRSALAQLTARTSSDGEALVRAPASVARYERVQGDLGAISDACTGAATGSDSTADASQASSSPSGMAGGTTGAATTQRLVGYFTQWSVDQRGYTVKDIETSGAAAKLTDLLYAFAGTDGGKCTPLDDWADTGKPYTARESVDGRADDVASETALKGSFHQLLELKRLHPRLNVLLSVGGWTRSGGFGQAAKDPAAFARSCADYIDDPQWKGLFDGIDIDWEYPNACGETCDNSGPNAFATVVAAVRKQFGPSFLVTAATTADGTPGGTMSTTDYAAAANDLDWIMPMTYDYFGAWDPKGPTAPNAPLTQYAGIPKSGFTASAGMSAMVAQGVPKAKILLGLPFYGRGWTGVRQNGPGGTASGPAPGREPGFDDYGALVTRCPSTGTVGGTAYAKCGSEWWSYDTPATTRAKVAWERKQGYAGAFFWELSNDSSDAALTQAAAGAER